MTLVVDPIRAMEKYNPLQPRDLGGEDGGQWVKGPGAPDLAPGDKLKLGKRAPAGFSLKSSRKVRTDYADVAVAEVDTPDGPEVRIGVIGNESGKWDAGFAGETRKAELRQKIAEMQAQFDSGSADVDEDELLELNSELEALDNERTAIVAAEMMPDFQRQLDAAMASAKDNKVKRDAESKLFDTLDVKHAELTAKFGDRDLPPDALAQLEDINRQRRALSEEDIDGLITSTEVRALNGARVRVEVWGSDDVGEQWVNSRLYVLSPGETTDDAYESDSYGRFPGLKGLNKLIETMAGGRSMESRSLEAFAVMSDSPAVQLMLYARALEATDSFLRKGKRISVNRGKGGKFARKGVSDIADAVADAVSDDAPSAPSAPKPRRSAVAKALASGDPNALDGMSREALRREAKARGLEPPRGVSEDVLRDMLWDDEQSAGNAAPRDGTSVRSRRNDKARIEGAFGPSVTKSLFGDAPSPLAKQGEYRRTFTDEELGLSPKSVGPGPSVAELRQRKVAAYETQKMLFAHSGPQRGSKEWTRRREELDQTLRNSTDRAELQAAADEWNTLTALEPHPSLDRTGRPSPATGDGKPARGKPKADLDGGGVVQAIAGIREAPRPGDDKRMADLLSGLSHKDLDAIAEGFGENVRGTREQKRKQLVDRVAYQLDMDAIMRGGTDQKPATREDADSYFSRFRAGHQAAMQADRDARDARAKREQADEILDNLPADREGRAKAHAEVGKLTLDADRLDPAAARGSEIDAIIANPQPGDRDRLKEIFGGMNLEQLKQVALDNGRSGLVGSNKAAKVHQLVETLIGRQIDSRIIRAGNWGVTALPEPPGKA